MSENGQNAAYTQDALTPRDLLRAKVALDGRNPYELMDDPCESAALVIWCIKSRTDPAFTWDQALDTPFSALVDGTAEVPPQTQKPEPNGTTNGSSDHDKQLETKPSAVDSAPSSAPIST
jgi:hypothetical protein